MMNKIKFFFILLILPLLQSCTSVDNKTYFDKYEKAFKELTQYKTHYIERNNMKIHVREFGIKTEQPSIVLMHGFPDSMHLYDWLVPELMENNHIITFDFIGWGDSDKPDGHRYDFKSLINDLDVVVTKLKLNSLILVAHDASGPTGIDWSFDNQDKVAGLVLLNSFYNPMPTLIPPEEIAIFSTPGIKRWFSVKATTLSDSLYISRYNKQMDKFISTKSLREPFKKILGHQFLNIRTAFYGLNRVLRKEVEKNASKVSRLKTFKPPVRIVFGNDDPYLNNGVAKEFHKLYRDSELFLIEKAGHFVQVDKPKQVAKLILGIKNK